MKCTIEKVNVSKFKQVIKSLQAVNSDILIQVNLGNIRLFNMAPSHTFVYWLTIDKSFFNIYENRL